MRKVLRYLLRVTVPLLFVAGFLAVALPPTPAYAIDDPDSPPQVSAVYVYEFSDGSVGVLIDYYLDYTTPFPDEPVTDAYLAVFVDTLLIPTATTLQSLGVG